MQKIIYVKPNFAELWKKLEELADANDISVSLQLNLILKIFFEKGGKI